jgi:hypothetical protein
MMQLPAVSSGRLPQMLTQMVAELPFGSQTQVRVGDGQLSAFLAYVGVDRSIGTAKYALRVLNNTPFKARAELFVEAQGVQISAYPLGLNVAPYSMRDDIMAVRMDVTGPYDRAIAHVVSDDSRFTVEAPPPPALKRPWLKWSAAVAAPFLLAAAVAMCEPHVLDVSAPQKALVGSLLQVPYQVSGIGSVEYDFATRDGLQLAAGLSSQSGILKLQMPHDATGSPYVLHVRIRNAFMNDEQTRTISAVVPRSAKRAQQSAPPASLIEELSVSPSPVQAGKPLAVRYATNAQAGDVWLIDASGTTWAHAELAKSGSTQFDIPKAAAGKDMRVVVHAQRGPQHAESSVGFSVLPSAVLADANVAGPSPFKRPARAAAADLVISPNVVAPGGTVIARISGARGDVRVTMMTASGATVAQGDIAEGGTLSLNAPSVSSPATFFIVATLTNGVSQQSIMKRLVVTPR